MKCSLGISNFLEEISSLSQSVVFLYFFALIAEEGFLISSCYSLELAWGLAFPEAIRAGLWNSRRTSRAPDATRENPGGSPLQARCAEFQRIARRDKKAFFSDQCKEIEENNRLGKTRDLFKKIRDTNISCKDGHSKGWKWYGSNRSRRY